MARYLEVVDEIENEITQVTTKEAEAMQAGAAVGDFIIDPLPPIDFGRIAAQTAKQVIVQRVREAERKRQYEEYKDRVAEIVNGIVKRTDFGNITVDLGRAEGVIRRDESIPRESRVLAIGSELTSMTCARNFAAADLFIAQSPPIYGKALCSRGTRNL